MYPTMGQDGFLRNLDFALDLLTKLWCQSLPGASDPKVVVFGLRAFWPMVWFKNCNRDRAWLELFHSWRHSRDGILEEGDTPGGLVRRQVQRSLNTYRGSAILTEKVQSTQWISKGKLEVVTVHALNRSHGNEWR